MEIGLVYILKALILPPGCFILLMTTGLLLSIRYKNTGLMLIAVTLVGFYLLSLSVFTGSLATQLETYPALNVKDFTVLEEQAIVVLGGGMHAYAPEYGAPVIISNRTLVRLRYAAKLAKKTGLPVLAVGGRVIDQNQASEATLMSAILQDEFNVAVRWQEHASRNTAENAQNSRVILAEQGITRIVLVTHARHMPRALKQFQHVGFKVTAAPMSFLSGSKLLNLLDFLPSASALSLNSALLHEVLGSWWYQLRYN